MDGKLSLHDLQTGRRLTQSARVADCTLIKVLRWRVRLLPPPSPQKERLLPPRPGSPQAEVS